MTTITLPRATVEQALDALVSESSLSAVAMQQRMDAITALRAALAQQAEPVAFDWPRKACPCRYRGGGRGREMTDRELLELAAKAAGIDTTRCLQYADGAFDWPGKAGRWNPLTDDVDALRLAVRLRFHARQFPLLDDGYDAPLGMVEVWRVDDDDPLHVEFLRNGDDRFAATRLAIVSAAAEIGRGMK